MNENIGLSKMSRRRFFKSCARKRLFSDWIKQILAVLLVGIICVGLVEFGICSSDVVSLITSDDVFADFILMVYCVLSVAIVIPLLYGLLYFEINAVEYNKSDLTDLFYGFSSAEMIGRAYSLFYHFLIRTIWCFVPVIALVVAKNVISENFPQETGFLIKNVSVYGFVFETLLVVCLFVGFVLSSKQLFGAYVAVRFQSEHIPDCFFAAKACMYGSKAEMTWLFISFLPLFVVSLFSFGLLYVIYFVPYVLISFTLFSKYIYEKEMYTRNTENILYSMNDIEN